MRVIDNERGKHFWGDGMVVDNGGSGFPNQENDFEFDEDQASQNLRDSDEETEIDSVMMERRGGSGGVGGEAPEDDKAACLQNVDDERDMERIRARLTTTVSREW